MESQENAVNEHGNALADHLWQASALIEMMHGECGESFRALSGDAQEDVVALLFAEIQRAQVAYFRLNECLPHVVEPACELKAAA